MSIHTSRSAVLAGLLLLALPVAAAAQAPAAKSIDAEVMASEAFLGAHPDMRYRLEGLEAYREGDYKAALSHFRRAARYADKPAQAMVAEMLWQGLGEPANRPLAYAWMDLAAERQFKLMLAKREQFWSELDEQERQQALSVGEAVYAEYGDAVAQPRLERRLRSARRSVTGSRTGFVGTLSIIIPGPGGEQRIDGSQFYQKKFWDPEHYWRWQSDVWKDPPQGRVEIGPLQSAPSAGHDAGAGEESDSR